MAMTNDLPGIPARCETCGHRIVVMPSFLFGEIVSVGHDPNCLAYGTDGRRREGYHGGNVAELRKRGEW